MTTTTAVKEDISPVAHLGEPAQVITYPISVDYVNQWTLVRALSEAVANAIDADPTGFSVSYDDEAQELRIEDNAEGGMGVESMIFGWSDKTGRNDVIGQFGEGLKIATIRAVSDKAVRYMLIESVGMKIVPAVVDHNSISVLNIPNRSKKSPQVLAWNLYPSDRKTGTLLRVGVSRKVYEDVFIRFRHLTAPGEVSLSENQILANDPGNIYIGGVLVTRIKELVYGYDFSLQLAKTFQNRDRTVLDHARLSYALRQVAGEVEDKVIIKGWVQAALAGTLSEHERGFFRNNFAGTVRMKKVWQEIAAETLPEEVENLFYSGYNDTPQHTLTLTDKNLKEVTVPQNMGTSEFYDLMGLLGVKQANKSIPKTKKEDITWVKGKLDKDEKARLDTAVKNLRKFFGEEAVGRVRVYEEIDPNVKVQVCHVLGFYQPNNGLIAIKRSELANDKSVWETLFHEVGHRIAHKKILDIYSYEYADRTRGFESTLVAMGSIIARHYVMGEPLPEPVKEKPFFAMYGGGPKHQIPAHLVWSFSRNQKPANQARPENESIFANRVRAVTTVAFEEWAANNHKGKGSAMKAYEKATMVSVSDISRITRGAIPPQMTMERLTDICSPLGINAGLVWWATRGVIAQTQGRAPTSKLRKFSAKNKVQALIATDAVLTDPRLADLSDQLENIMEGRTDFGWDTAINMEPINAIMDILEGGWDQGKQEEALAQVERPSSRYVNEAWDNIGL